jgi:hypothetical protein
VGSRVGLDDVEKRKFLTLPVLKLNPLVVQPMASRYTDYPQYNDLTTKRERRCQFYFGSTKFRWEDGRKKVFKLVMSAKIASDFKCFLM